MPALTLNKRLTPSLTGVALAVLGLLTPAAHAQSLRELYDAARAYDATYLSVKAQAESTQYRIEQAEALLRPNVALQGSAARTQSHTPLSGNRNLNAIAAGINASQPLINRASGLQIEKARKSLDVAQADLANAEQDLIVRLAQAYFDVLGAQDTLGTAQANKKAIGEQLASAKRNFEVGTATITDTREAQARFDLATAQEIAADNDLRSKRIALDQLVGRSGVAPLPLLTGMPLPDGAQNGVEAWVAKVEQAPTVRKALAGYEIAKVETLRTQASQQFTLDLEGSVASAHNSGTSAASAGGKGISNNAKLGVTLRMPLYTGGSLQNQVKEALSLEEKARNDLDAARRAVAQVTRQVYFGVQSGQAQVRALQAAESSTRLALEATQLGYKVGVRVNLDVLNAQTQLFTTQRDLSKARYDVLVNGLRLRQAAGVLSVSDIDSVNQLLGR
jgi:outer membrane protein